MYILRHFVAVAITFIRCAFSLQFRLCGVWLLDSVLWLDDSLRLVFCRRRKVKCNCCGWRGNRFFMQTLVWKSHVHRSRELCPRCESLTRQRQLARYLEGSTRLLSLDCPRILEIGPSRADVKWLHKHGLKNIIIVDITCGTASILMDITQLGFKGNIFDFVVCSHVLEHAPADLVAMREMLRVMKMGGTCVIQVPMQLGLKETVEYGIPRPDEFDHVRAYGQDFGIRLASVGFDIKCTEDGLFEVTKPHLTAKAE